ncbi:hypothetical protein Nepgr_023840 [Nepenthes gracilis]|uniref:Uncharacterized protein n=1 Tax=Nepenthes gracilis TaxID=150966 RepID=A0AAD3T3D5_NEPGR|nr:hypothetical protein Nepgr_023840 [Nepenthes gracilis]
MALDAVGTLSSPHRRTPGQFSSQSPLFRKQSSPADLSCLSLIKRHSFLLTAIVLLAFLCSIYLYFAVMFGSNGSCSGLLGTERELCRLKNAKDPLAKGKLKFF